MIPRLIELLFQNKQQINADCNLNRTASITLIISLLFAATSISVAQSASDNFWPNGMEIDFGEIPKRGVEHYDTLLLHNPTDMPFVIENIRQSCGCTAVDWPNTPIEPGQTIPIQIAFRCTKGGFVERHLDVYLSHTSEKTRIWVLADCPKL